jgi:hypothetical protein
LNISSLQGEFSFEVQRFRNKVTNEYKSYFEFTDQFQAGYISERLKEYSCWLSCKSSFKTVEEILFRNTGSQLLSDQKISQLVLSKAAEISSSEENKNAIFETMNIDLQVNTEVDLYDKESKEIVLLEDGILVRGQKEHRQSKESTTENHNDKKSWSQTDACMLECPGGDFLYIIGGLESETNSNQTLPSTVKRVINEQYGKTVQKLNVVSITDGAKSIRKDLSLIFGVVITIILDWYHLTKKCKELMSMIALNKQDKELHLNYIRKHCWEGEVDKAIIYLKTKVKTKNEAKHKELIGYLEKHKDEIINYKKRKESGKCIGSGRMECGVNQVVGSRQKKKGMSWSKKGNKALAILQVQILNNNWNEIWNLNKAA